MKCDFICFFWLLLLLLNNSNLNYKPLETNAHSYTHLKDIASDYISVCEQVFLAFL